MNIIEYINELFNVQKMSERKVREDYRMIRDVPKEYITQEMCKSVVKKNYTMIIDVPKEYITREMYENVFSEWLGMIYIIPEEYLMREMCLKAVKDDVQLSLYIPEQYYEDAEFIELRRCKGSKDGNDSCEDDDDIECLGNCDICHKVVCPSHSSECNECMGLMMTMCKECSEDYPTILCRYHLRN